MQRRIFVFSFVSNLVLALLFTGFASAAARVGVKAPSFSATDSEGHERKLADYKGKFVVLEWFNHSCPFVQKHYSGGNIPGLQKKWRDKDVVWLSINSGGKTKSGYQDPEKTNQTAKEKGSAATAILIDSSGEVGKLYGASATPHMFVIDPKGKVVYAGAIDSIASTEESDVDKATNYVDAALQAATNGKPVTIKATPAYGCGVKYE